jgi:hypothetical protein
MTTTTTETKLDGGISRAEANRLRQITCNIRASAGTVWGSHTSRRELNVTQMLDDLERAVEANTQLVDMLMLIEGNHENLVRDVEAMRRVLGTKA